MASALGSCQVLTPRSCFQHRRPGVEDGCSTSYSNVGSLKGFRSRPRGMTVARAAKEDLPTEAESVAAAELRRREFWDSKNNDPITNKGDFIWNVNWRERLDMEEQLRKAEIENANKKEEESYGFLSLSRPLMLDSVEVDLSDELRQAARKRQEEQQVALQKAERSKYRAAPTRREMKAWAKAGKNATGLQRQMLEDAKKAQLRKRLDRKEEAVRYEKLKQELQLFTLAIGLACLGGTYVKYDAETALSYAGGLTGALVYLRMLSSSVDNLGQSGGKAAARSALGQPRLLVPVVMVMAFNRWNALAAPSVGLELHLIPMLVGFFTYKLSTLLQTFRDLVPQSSPPSDT